VGGGAAYWWLQGPNQWPAALPELRTAAPSRPVPGPGAAGRS
jgi:hypothetical protein